MSIKRDTTYFNKFPLVNYNGETCINILKRSNFNQTAKNYLSSFYTHTLSRQETIDELTYNYYEDVNYDWLVYLANDVIDPRYDVPVSDSSFNNYIVKKYGSLRTAKRKIIHYKNNYEIDDSVISSAAYEALSPTFSNTEDPDVTGNPKKYWEPVINATGVIGYRRSKDPTIYNTNKIISFDVSDATDQFVVGDVVEKDSETIAEIAWANTTSVTLKNVRGDFSSDLVYELTCDTGPKANFVRNTYQEIRQVIPLTEFVYYTPVSYYDYELELNDKKKEIYLIDKSYKETLSNRLTKILE